MAWQSCSLHEKMWTFLWPFLLCVRTSKTALYAGPGSAAGPVARRFRRSSATWTAWRTPPHPAGRHSGRKTAPGGAAPRPAARPLFRRAAAGKEGPPGRKGRRGGDDDGLSRR